jgi:hypothetical protein
MKQRLTYLLPFVAVAAVLVANGCGDDDDDPPNTKGSAGVGGTGGSAGKSGAGQGGAGAGGAGSGGAGAGGAGAGGAGAGGAGAGGAGAGGAGAGGAGAGGAGAGGAGAGGAGNGGGGFGGVPNVVPADTCETAPTVVMPPNQIGTIVSAQSFGPAGNDYAFKCNGDPVTNGPDLVFGVTTNGIGLMTVRSRNVDPNLDVGILALPACGSSEANEIACAANVGSGLNENFSFTTKAGQESFFLAVENETGIVGDPSKFSLEAYFSQALTTAATNSCATLPQAFSLSAAGNDDDLTTSVSVTGTTTGSGGDFDVPVTGSCTAGKVSEPKAGADQIIAMTPTASGTVIVLVDRVRGDAAFVPVISARQDACASTPTAPLACAVGAVGPKPGTAIAVNVTAGQTYHVIIDSLNASTSGQYLANFTLYPPATVLTSESNGRGGTRHVVRSAEGKVLHTWNMGSHGR